MIPGALGFALDDFTEYLLSDIAYIQSGTGARATVHL